MQFLVVAGVAFVGGYLAQKMKIPAGFTLGALCFVAIFSIAGGTVVYPSCSSAVVRCIAGVLVGMQIDRKSLADMRKQSKLLGILWIGMLLYVTAIACFMHFYGKIDWMTSLYASTPGGLSDMSIIAMSVDVNLPQVVGMQTVRMVSSVAIFPALCQFSRNASTVSDRKKGKKFQFALTHEQSKQTISVFAVAACGAYFGWALHLPAGEMLGAMGATAIFNLCGGKAYLPPVCKIIMQLGVGVLIGSTFTMESVHDICKIGVIALFSVLIVVVFGLTMGAVLERMGDIDRTTALLACAPGGLQGVVVIADAMGADLTVVSTFQAFRLISVLAVFPTAIHFFIQILAG